MGLGKLFGKLLGGGGSAEAAPAAEAVEYNGFKIIPAPIHEGGQYRTAGSIQREQEGVTREAHFIRADNNSDRQAAIDHSVRKAQQIIDEQGESLLERENV